MTRDPERRTGFGQVLPISVVLRQPEQSCIVNQPRRPCTHRAAVSAPRANVPRSRTLCVSVMVSDGPSKPIVCVPGIEPARVAATSIGRGVPGRLASRPSSDKRGPGRRVALRRVVQLVHVGAVVRVRPRAIGWLPSQSRRTEWRPSRNSERRRRRCPRVPRASRTRALASSQPVVPIDDVDPERGEAPHVVFDGGRDREVDRYVNVRPPAGPETLALLVRDVVQHAGDLASRTPARAPRRACPCGRDRAAAIAYGLIAYSGSVQDQLVAARRAEQPRLMRRRHRASGQARRASTPVQPRPGPQDPAEENGVPSGTRDEGTKRAKNKKRSDLGPAVRDGELRSQCCREHGPGSGRSARQCRRRAPEDEDDQHGADIATACASPGAGIVSRRRTRRHSRSLNTASMSCIRPSLSGAAGASSRPAHGRQ